MAGRKVQAVARVQITVEFAVGGNVWDADSTVDQVHAQAREAALNILRRGLTIEGTNIVGSESPCNKTRADVIGEPTVTAILVEAQR